MSHILAQVESTNLKLQSLFDELGLTYDERETREKILHDALSAALENQLVVAQEERDLLYARCEESQNLIQSMLVALKDVNPRSILGSAADSLLSQSIEPPLNTMLQSLEAAHVKVEEAFSSRLIKVNGYLSKLKDLSEKIDSILVTDTIMPVEGGGDLNNLDLSNSRIAELQKEVLRWENEYELRVQQVGQIAADIVSLWAELGVPQEELDTEILDNYKSNPEALGVRSCDVARIERTKSILEEEKAERIQKIETLRKDVTWLWNRLSEDEQYISDFTHKHQGFTKQTIEAYGHELARLNEKKKEHIQLFIQEAREQLQTLWARLYFSEEETALFTPAWSEIYTDASLEAHENEISRLNGLIDERRHLLGLVDSYNDIQRDEQVLEESSHDSSRLFSRGGNTGGGRRDPGRLLREEQMRKRIAKRKPRVVQELRMGLQAWSDAHDGCAFTVNGKDLLDQLKQEEENLVPKTTPRRKPLIPGGASVSRSAAATRSMSSSAAQASATASRHPVQQRSVTMPQGSPITRNGAASKPLITPSVSRPITRYQPASAFPNTASSRVTKPSQYHPRVQAAMGNKTRPAAKQLANPIQRSSSPKAKPAIPSVQRSPSTVTRQGQTQGQMQDHTQGQRASPAKAPATAPVYRSVSPVNRSPIVRSPTRIPVSSRASDKENVSPNLNRLKLHPMMSPVKLAPPMSVPLSKPLSSRRNTSTNGLLSSPLVPHPGGESPSSDEEFEDPNYLRWRQNQIKQLSNSPSKVDR